MFISLYHTNFVLPVLPNLTLLFVGNGGHSLVKSPACRSVSDLVQLFKPVETTDRDDDLKRSSPACHSVSDLIKLFEKQSSKENPMSDDVNKNANVSYWNTGRAKSTLQLHMSTYNFGYL